MTAKIPLLFSTTYFVVLSCVLQSACAFEESETVFAELQLDDLELVDACENIASAEKTAFLTQNFQDKIKAEEYYGTMLKAHADVLKKFSDIQADVERNWTYQVKPGDGLLPDDKWIKLVHYKNHIQELISQTKLPCLNQTGQASNDDCFVSRSDYQNILKSSRNQEELKNTWTASQEIYNVSDVEGFSDHLQLVKEAASLNEFESVQEYWEYLNDYQGAYARADEFWEEISPFYIKLQEFVKIRLFKFYNITGNLKEIPVYLLGESLGSDWSSIADIILPHPQLHYDVESFLKYKTAKEIYQYAEIVARKMSLGTLGLKFWKNSNFNSSLCGPKLVEFCAQQYAELIDCNRVSWLTYLNAHENILKIALNNKDFTSLPRQNLRFTAIDDAIETLGSVLAIETLPYHGILADDVFQKQSEHDPAKMTKLLLSALRIMPRLAYYLSVDKWRLAEIETSNKNVEKSWWKFRKDYQAIAGVINSEPQFLEDNNILLNKPYISKFFGTMVAFQLLEYYQEQSENNTNIVEEFGKDEAFTSMIKDRSTTDWPYVLTLHYGMEVTPSALLNYFKPLNTYFESAPLKQAPIVSTTTTTTTTTITSNPVTKTTPKTALEDRFANVVVNDEPKNSLSRKNSGKVSSSGVLDDHTAMYAGVGLVVAVACLLGVGFGYKKLRRRRRTNNRRFDT